MTFLLGFSLGGMVTFCLCFYGVYRIKRSFIIASVAAERLAYSVGVMMGRREAQQQQVVSTTARFNPSDHVTFTADSRGMN